MKTLVTIMIFAMLANVALAQQKDSTKADTKIEAFSKKKSRLFHKVEYSVGTSKLVKVNVLTIRDVVTDETEKGVVLEWEESGTYSIRTFRSYLDKDEVEDVIKAITKLISVIKANVQESYTEYVFSTRGGVKIAIYSEVGKPWTATIENSRVNSFKSFKVDDLEKLNQSLIVSRDRIK